MKTKLILSFIFITGSLLTITNCKKEDETTIPLLSTANLTNLTDTSATSGGTITRSGGLRIISRGVCWSTFENPTIDDNKIIDTTDLSNFTCNIMGLQEGGNYYVRAFATNGAGTGYGQSVTLGTFINQSLSYGSNYLNDIYYSLENGVVSTVPRATWDIAFSVSTRSSSIIINESTGTILKAYPSSWTWAKDLSDTTGFHSWTTLYNSDTDWEVGAFNANATGHPNYGWGTYNTVNHNIENPEGSELYVIKLANGSLKKIWIEMKFSSSQQYSFRFADLNGSNEQIISNKDLSFSSANYVYFSIQNNTWLDREPDATTWDLLFTKWHDNAINYNVTGTLQNIGINAIDLNVSDQYNITYTDDQFTANINTIGSNWKVNDPVTHLYTIPTNKVYIVKNKAGETYQINFINFTGSTTGNFSFYIKQL
jgi:hypothetical protein